MPDIHSQLESCGLRVEEALLLEEDAVLLGERGELLQPLLQQDGGHRHLPGVGRDPQLGGGGETGGSRREPRDRPPAGEHPHEAAAAAPESHVQAGREGDDGGGGGGPLVRVQARGEILPGGPDCLLRPQEAGHDGVYPLTSRAWREDGQW